MASFDPKRERRTFGGGGLVAIFLVTLAALLLLALVAARTAGAAAVESKTVESKLPTAVRVYCTDNTNWSYTLIAAQEIYLDRNACAALAGQPSQYTFGLAAYVLYHEWWHAAFRETDENLTDCGALAILPYVLHRYWNVRPSLAAKLDREAVGFAHYGCRS